MPSRHKETSVMPRSVPQTGQPKRRFNWPTGMPQIIALLLVLVVDSLVAPHFFQIVVQDGRLFGSPIDILNRAAPVALLAIGMTLCLPSVIIRITMNMAGIILTAAGLGFLGLGAQPPEPEWGAMISSGRTYMMECWWVVTIPGLAILINSLAFNFLGDGLRDILDPRSA
jgi:ribose/xylose/arabinose/galactoside ABC-type transport system permease subunit